MSQTDHDPADSSSEDSQNGGVPLGDTPRSTTSPSGSDATENYSTTRSAEEPDDTESEDELITTEPAAWTAPRSPAGQGPEDWEDWKIRERNSRWAERYWQIYRDDHTNYERDEHTWKDMKEVWIIHLQQRKDHRARWEEQDFGCRREEGRVSIMPWRAAGTPGHHSGRTSSRSIGGSIGKSGCNCRMRGQIINGA